MIIGDQNTPVEVPPEEGLPCVPGIRAERMGKERVRPTCRTNTRENNWKLVGPSSHGPWTGWAPLCCWTCGSLSAFMDEVMRSMCVGV